MTDKYQNKTYIKNKKIKIKHHEIQLINLIKKYYRKNVIKNFLDVGCGNGSLINHLKKNYPKSIFTGIDIHNEIIKIAKKKNNNCNFVKKNFLKYYPKKKFEIIIASGFLSFFNNFEKPYDHLLKLLNNTTHSRIFIFGRFNTSNVDTIIKFRDNSFDNKWRNGFTSYSIKTISDYLKKKNFKFYFKKFYLPINIKRNKENIKTYTITTKNNKKFILNNANIVAEFYFLVISNNIN